MKAFAVILLLAGSSVLRAQTPVDSFTVNNVDGVSVSLDSYNNAPGVVVIFTSNYCPYDGYYKLRIRDLIKSYNDKIPFILVNSHPDESLQSMKIAYGAWALPVPYLADKDQVAMDALGAKKSPEVFLLKSVNGKFVSLYNGALDDNPQAPEGVTSYYIKQAIDKLLASQDVNVPSVRPVGCSIRKK
ncbi:MAG TPA: redoxin domain-containing protein [Cyclobacteriaceae bacterium]|nr:redoxin domain-containing protein [Cyclobacteriaceae bacterium]